VIRGCVPKKLFWYGSSFSENFEESRGFGWGSQDPPHDFKALLEKKVGIRICNHNTCTRLFIFVACLIVAFDCPVRTRRLLDSTQSTSTCSRMPALISMVCAVGVISMVFMVGVKAFACFVTRLLNNCSFSCVWSLSGVCSRWFEVGLDGLWQRRSVVWQLSGVWRCRGPWQVCRRSDRGGDAGRRRHQAPDGKAHPHRDWRPCREGAHPRTRTAHRIKKAMKTTCWKGCSETSLTS
jgi:hypothetical protein